METQLMAGLHRQEARVVAYFFQYIERHQRGVNLHQQLVNNEKNIYDTKRIKKIRM